MRASADDIGPKAAAADTALPASRGEGLSSGPALSGGRIPSLDGLRAISILLVMIGHAAFADHPQTLTSLPSRIALSILGNGALGVQIFFVISGFLITHLLLREHQRTGKISLKQFYVRRAFRILPAFYTFVLIAYLLSVAGIFDVTLRDVAHAATFTWLYQHGHWNWHLGHTWSLSVEEQFYLLWPAALVLVGATRSPWLALAIMIWMPIARTIEALATPHGWTHQVFYVLTVGRFDVLMYGCMMALLWDSPRFQRVIHARHAGPVCLALALLAVITSDLKIFSPSLANGSTAYVAWADTVVGIGVAAGVTYVVAHAARSPLARVLNARPLMWIGVLSYSLYLWQQLLLTPEPEHTFQKLPYSAVLTLALAMASYNAIERPMIRLRMRLTHDQKPSGPSV